jgi:tellurite resistance protein TerA
MLNLPMGGNTALNIHKVFIEIRTGQVPMNVTVLQIYAGGKVRGDGDMCFFNQKSISQGGITLDDGNFGEADVVIDLQKIGPDVEKIVLTGTLENESQTFAAMTHLRINLTGGIDLEAQTTGRTEKALILMEVYRRNGAWKVRNVMQGFNGGLKDLVEHFGVSVAATPQPTPVPVPVPQPVRRPVVPAPAPTPPRVPPVVLPEPPAAKPISLNKISLSKSQSTVSLTKTDGKFGKIRVNLNWNQRPKSGGMFGLRSSAIDLDVGALIEDTHGQVTAVQALGNTFGDYGYFPYVKLMGDDRTGAVSDGEWLDINGDMWPEMHRILIYAFIYNGAPNWAETDGVIRIMVPGQPEIEVRMNELGSQMGMCAVAVLENVGGQIKVSREVSFHRGHKAMDEHYGWGLNWSAGSK